ncbi:hypothetical protein [Burkholderia vietnamiensis]|uniref:hypothetical protein n=1 Tax=Burkholderia vietnamiensis TaxID=60552 RepID=UPI00264D6A37|nr:hypothetical protein [Burkholderia vietnamiensis]MDN8037871.1 hypothetical protein [Burkholderia vietnamiensis]
MLADFSDRQVQVGSFGRDVHLPSASLDELIEFIADELPRWRDHPDRSKQTSETVLTSQLCSHLNTAARHSTGWDILQFRVEEPDELRKGRKVDLIASPCGPTIWIDGRRCTQFDTLLPIECKRLPTPKSKDRDEREYVINGLATTGGIQRFKEGLHGGTHSRAAMIGYVQAETPQFWQGRLNGWIADLDVAKCPGWSLHDLIGSEFSFGASGLVMYHSEHVRTGGLPKISIRHLWIAMN